MVKRHKVITATSQHCGIESRREAELVQAGLGNSNDLGWCSSVEDR